VPEVVTHKRLVGAAHVMGSHLGRVDPADHTVLVLELNSHALVGLPQILDESVLLSHSAFQLLLKVFDFLLESASHVVLGLNLLGEVRLLILEFILESSDA
jgi:hypothetical protein